MNKRPEDYIKEPYSRILIPNDDGTFSAEFLELPGCFAQGSSPDEAFHNLEAAAKSWIEASIQQGLEIPEPAMNQGYSGKIALRLPRGLHRQAARMAEREGVSLNHFLSTAIAARLGAEDFYSYLAERFEARMATTAARVMLHISALEPQRAELPTDILTLPAPMQWEGVNEMSTKEILNA
jgi:predicted RNase H-like HicB family nuclease